MAAAVGLVLFGALMAPSRSALLVTLLLLLVPITCARREAVVPALLLLLPFYTLVRRLFLLREPAVLNLDPLILLPDVLAAIAGVHLLIALLRRGKAGERVGAPVPPRLAKRRLLGVDLLVILLLAVIGLSFVVGVRNGLPPALNGVRTFGLYVLLYFFARLAVRRWRQVSDILAITLFAGLLTGFYGICQTLVGLPAYDQIYFDNTSARTHVIGGFVRAFSTFQFTVHFSVFMLIAFFCALTLFRQRGCGRLVRMMALLTLMITLGGIAVTFVRSTWVGLAAGLAAYALLSWVRRPLLRLAIVLAALPVALFLWGVSSAPHLSERMPTESDASGALQARAKSVLTASPESDLYGRYLGLQESLRIASSSLLGYGLGSTSAERFGGGSLAWTGDSQVTTLLVELGWPGLILFTLVFAAVLKRNVSAIDAAGSGLVGIPGQAPQGRSRAALGPSDPRDRHGTARSVPSGRRDLRTLLIGLAAMQVGLLVASLTGGPLWYAQPACVYGWLLAGIAVNAGEQACAS
jgi:hypothetical protein